MTTTTNTNASLTNLVSYEMAANYISRLTTDKVEDFKKGVFKTSQVELEKLWRSLDEDFSVKTFNRVLGYNISKDLFEDVDALRRHLKEDGIKDLDKIRSLIKNENKNANEVLNFMVGLVKEQASDIARIVEARLK